MDSIKKSEAIREVVACANNPIYFIKRYVKITHVDRGLVPFDLYDYQEDAILNFLNNDKVIINKGRQLGFSTVVAAFVAWLIMFHEDKTVLAMAINREVAKNLIEKVKTIVNNLPSWMWLSDVKENRVHMFGLKHRSWIKAIAKTKNVGRSESLSLLIIDEAGHIDKMNELWKAVASTVATGGKIIALSTPNGMEDNNWFYKFCKESQEGTNGWKYQEVYWWQCPEYAIGLRLDPDVPGGKTSPWFEDFTRGMTAQEIYQELLTSFLQSGNTFFEPTIIELYEKNAKDPIKSIFMDRCLWIWKWPEEGKRYIVSADTAMGTAADFSCAHVMELENMEVVAEYKGKIPPDVFAHLLIEELAKKYNDAYIVVENTGVGQATITSIKMFEYNNLAYFDDVSGKLIDKWWGESKGINAGIQVNAKTRPLIVQKLEEFLRKKFVSIYSKRFVNEMKSFVIKNGRPQATKGNNDDTIMSLALCVWVRDSCPEFRSRNSSVLTDTMKMYESVKINSNKKDFSESNYVEREKERVRRIVEAQSTIRVGTHSFPWIFRTT